MGQAVQFNPSEVQVSQFSAEQALHWFWPPAEYWPVWHWLQFDVLKPKPSGQAVQDNPSDEQVEQLGAIHEMQGWIPPVEYCPVGQVIQVLVVLSNPNDSMQESHEAPLLTAHVWQFYAVQA